MNSPHSKIGPRRRRCCRGWFLRKASVVRAVSGIRALSPATEDAVRKWRSAPADAHSAIAAEVTFALVQ
jgi:hypothetical protein